MNRPATISVAILLLAASIAGCIGDDPENKRPTADAGVDVDAEVGEEVVFTGVGIDDDGSIASFRWDFDGDGEWDWTGEVGARIHVYDRPGSFQAVLQVEDDEGAKAEDTRWVNVTATVTVTVNWTTGIAFDVHVSDKLDVANMEVDWTMEGVGPTPITRTFTLDAGLQRVNDTTLRIEPTVAALEPGQTHTIRVRIRDIVVARRVVDVVDVPDAGGAYDASYLHNLWDSRAYGPDLTELWRNGTMDVETRIGWSKGTFEGNGTWYTRTNSSGVVTDVWVTLDDASVRMRLGVDAGDTWWRYAGHGSTEQTSTTGFYVFAWVWDLLREMDNGSLVADDWRRVGRYSGANDTNGTFEWNHTSLGNQVRQNGLGDLYEVLKVRSEKTFDGTNLGRDFFLHNLTFDYDASRLIFHNRTVFRESSQEVGLTNATGVWRWTNTTWAGFVGHGNGTYNPDTLEYDPQEGARFTGPRPRVLVVGDAFAATNFYGLTISYLAKRSDTGPLVTGTGTVNVTGVLVEAIRFGPWGEVLHWYWALEDGPLPGLVYEERMKVVTSAFGGGTYDWYRNVQQVDPLT